MDYLGEFLGTAILVLLGNGVVANCVLKGTKGNNGGWIVITIGWAVAVLVPAAIFGGGEFTNHFNPALTIALASIDKFDWASVPGYVGCQMLGGMVGATLVWLFYKPHFDATKTDLQPDTCEILPDGTKLCDVEMLGCQNAILACFCTGPAIRKIGWNLLGEVIATMVLVFALGASFGVDAMGGSLSFVGVVILTLGMSLGGTTGYALNPARDLSPRIMHQVLPIKNKGNSDWNYSWVPVVGSIVGGLLGALLSWLVFVR